MPILVLVGSDDEIRAGKGRQALTVTQAAALIGVSERKFRTLAKEHALEPCARLLGADLYFSEEVAGVAPGRR